jgi:hypothetical protein
LNAGRGNARREREPHPCCTSVDARSAPVCAVAAHHDPHAHECPTTMSIIRWGAHGGAEAAAGSSSSSNRNIGSYASEEAEARAYDCAAVQARGPGAKRNFPGEAISKLPAVTAVTVGEDEKQRNSSRYVGAKELKDTSTDRAPAVC